MRLCKIIALKRIGANDGAMALRLLWGEFIRQLTYKAAWYGRTLVAIDRWYPNSQRCFACGYTLSSLGLDVREWTCPACGVTHDRDINAAKNICAVGQTALACGEKGRPARA
jgi:putative transposase